MLLSTFRSGKTRSKERGAGKSGGQGRLQKSIEWILLRLQWNRGTSALNFTQSEHACVYASSTVKNGELLRVSHSESELHEGTLRIERTLV